MHIASWRWHARSCIARSCVAALACAHCIVPSSHQVAIAALSRFFSDEAEVVYLDAPHPASGPAYDEVLQFFEPPFYEWWNAVEAGSGKVASSGDGEWTYQGLHASLAFVEGFMREHGPFDGLMGFSQGASVAALVALMQRNGKGFQVRVALRCDWGRGPVLGRMFLAAWDACGPHAARVALMQQSGRGFQVREVRAVPHVVV